ncbi:MAG: hypothetical protein M0Q94_00505 [Candidatus Cloacimonetes bacterium]|nr:hypothetical protein [Candidatus Cloacimonadota bacterium]
MAINTLQTKKVIFFILLFSLFCTTALFAGAKVQKLDGDNPFVVKNLQVTDVPNDDGSGLKITWEPLPIDARIISYRVYRGVSKDTLFYIGEISVNPKMGVSSPLMTYLDKDYNNFISIASPGKLKQEKGQAKDSPIYQEIPRDLSIVGPMFKKFNLLGVIPKKEFYYNTKKVEVDNEVYAGLKTHQFPIYKKLLPENDYYYTVIAVNERRKFMPYAEPVIGTPIDNSPEIPSRLYPVYVQDKNIINFEWEVPLYWTDIRAFDILVVKDEQAYNNWQSNQKDGQTAQYPEEMLEIIHRQILPQPYSPTTYTQLKLNDNKILDDNGEVVFEFTNDIKNYKFVLSYIDYSNLASFSKAYEITSINSNAIPVIPEVKILDRKNDKGDYMHLSWGKPFARITTVNYLNDTKTKLQMSYDYSSNEDNKVKNIYFEIFDNTGKELAKINEFFFDNVFYFTLSDSFDPQELKVKMTFKTINGFDESHIVVQDLIYDESINSLRPQKLKFDGFILDDYNYQLLKRPKSTQIYRVSKKFPVFDRETVDLISYESSVFKGITDYNLDKNLILVDYNIDFIYDKTTNSTIQTPIFASEANKVIDNLKKTVNKYQEKYDSAETEEDKSLHKMYIDHYQKQLDNQITILETNTHLQEINNIKGKNARVRKLAKLRERDKREFTYKMLISNGKGILSEKEISLDEQGNNIYYFPKPNWYNTEKTATLIASLIFGLLVVIMIQLAKRGKDLYIRPIAGIEEIDNAIGRATEMGRPILFCPGLSGINDVATLAGLSILSRVAKKAAEYDTRILVPCRDYIVMPIAQEIVREAHYEAGRPDSFDKNNVFFMSEQQFAYVAGVNGVMIRQKTATNFYMGMFFAESLIMTETGNATGAIQIAGTDAVTQIPFFITTCDYTLIGEELYAASAYMARQPLMLGTLKAQDYTKFLILIFLILGTLLSSLHITTIVDAFPNK